MIGIHKDTMLKNITYDNDLPIKIELLSIASYPLHIHPDIQLVYVLDGYVDLNLTFKTYRLQKNDFHYIHSEDIHSIYSQDKNNLVLILSVDIKYIESMYPNIRTTIFSMPTDKTLLLYHNQQLRLKYCMFLLLDELRRQTDGYVLRIEKLLKQIFGILHQDFRGFSVDKENKSFVYKRLQDIRQTERLGRIIDDIYKNYVEPSTLEEIATGQNLNPYYLSHLFSQTLGITYRDFINMVRVETSEYDLLTSNLSISHIALSSGFSNSTYYNKHFEFWFGMSPQEYRKTYAHRTITYASPIIKSHMLDSCADLVQEILDSLKMDFTEFSTEPANQTIQIDKINFDHSPDLRLNLNCCNPDFFSLEDEFFKSQIIFQPQFIKEHFSSVKIIVEASLMEKDCCQEPDLYAEIKRTLNDLITRRTSDFHVGMTQGKGTLYTKDKTPTPLYYILRFLAQKHDGLYIHTSYIIMRSGGNYHILCWNLNLAHAKEFTIKAGFLTSGSLVTISKINLSAAQLSNSNNVPWKALGESSLPETAARALTQLLFTEEKSFFTERKSNFTMQLSNKSLCFISILQNSQRTDQPRFDS